MFAALGEEVGFCRWVGRLGREATLAAPTGRGGWAGAVLVYLRAALLLEGPRKPAFRATVESARGGGALVAVDLGDADWVHGHGGSQIAYGLAAINPDILFASADAAAELGVPLEGIASIPVTRLDSGGCSVHGRRLLAPGPNHDSDALAAAFCVAFVDGIAPVEAAARAVLVAAL